MKRKREKSRASGEFWYELTAYFDPDGIQKLPMSAGRAFILGSIGKILVIEVSKDTPTSVTRELSKWLGEQNLEALVVSEGVKYLRLKRASPAEEKRLDQYMMKNGSGKVVREDR